MGYSACCNPEKTAKALGAFSRFNVETCKGNSVGFDAAHATLDILTYTDSLEAIDRVGEAI